MGDRPPLTFILAPSHRRFRQWCSDNRKSPNDPSLVVITTTELALRRLSGQRWLEGDEIVELWPSSSEAFDRGLYEEWLRQKRRMGCPNV